MESSNITKVGTSQLSDDIEKFAEEIVVKCIENSTEGRTAVAMVDLQQTEIYAENLAENLICQTIGDWAGKRILIVGVVALDITTIVEEYPEEDTEIMAIEHYVSRGGNAGNSATVLGHLGANVEFFGTVVQNRDFEFLLNDFKNNKVKTENVVVLDQEQHSPPVAFVWVSERTKTRTIVADFERVTELTNKDFEKLDLSHYKWIHFEGRKNVSDIVSMIEIIDVYNNDKRISDQIKVSVEIELPKSVCPQLGDLFDKANYIFVSKDYCREEGYISKEEAVGELLKRCKSSATVICPWGEDGAAAAANKEQVATSLVYPPSELVDTVGAGDTFMAGTIFSLCADKSIDHAIRFGCQVAGAKCGMRGYSGLKGFQKYFY